MIKNLSLKNRILMGYSIPLLLSILVAIVIYANIWTARESWKLEDDAHAIVDNIKDYGFSIAKMQRAARGYLLMKNDTSLKAFEEGEKAFSELSQGLDKMVKDPKQQENLHRIIEMGNRISEFNRKYIALANKGRQDKALELFRTGKGLKMAREMEGMAEDFEKKEYEILKGREKASENAMYNVIVVIVLGTLLSIFFAISSGLWLASRISRSITDTTNALSATSAEIASTVTQHERTANQQAAMVNETTVTVDELGASARQTSEQAASAAAVAQKALALTEEGSTAVKHAVNSMNSLKEKIGGVAAQILRLGEQTSQIGNIANLVKDIASQTNMLALNAAVEAARAGEHGKGFAVVAGEIRKLADQSRKSAEQANIIIADIQKATNSTIMVTEEGTKTAEDVTRLAQKVGELFNSLYSAANSVYENAQQVLLNARQQSAAVGQITEAMNSVSTGSKETAAGISQTKIGIEKLDEAAQNLKGMV